MNSKAASTFTIGRLAKRANVGIDTVRFYERRGLLPEPTRSPSGYRLYQTDSIDRIRFIRRAKELGFTLNEIELLLKLQDQGGPKTEVRDLTRNKISQIDANIRDLQKIRSALQDLSDRCTGKGNIDSCPIIDAMSTTEHHEN